MQIARLFSDLQPGNALAAPNVFCFPLLENDMKSAAKFAKKNSASNKN